MRYFKFDTVVLSKKCGDPPPPPPFPIHTEYDRQKTLTLPYIKGLKGSTRFATPCTSRLHSGLLNLEKPIPMPQEVLMALVELYQSTTWSTLSLDVVFHTCCNGIVWVSLRYCFLVFLYTRPHLPSRLSNIY